MPSESDRSTRVACIDRSVVEKAFQGDLIEKGSRTTAVIEDVTLRLLQLVLFLPQTFLEE